MRTRADFRVKFLIERDDNETMSDAKRFFQSYANEDGGAI